MKRAGTNLDVMAAASASVQTVRPIRIGQMQG